MTRHPALTSVLILALMTPVFAQEQSPKQQERPSDDEDVVRITTNLIQVDAVVTGKGGKPVTDLTAEDFEIEENGDKQQITNFSFVPSVTEVAKSIASKTLEVKNAPPAPPVRLRPEQVRRTIAIVVDDLGLSFESTVYVRKALKEYVDMQMQPADLVAIIRTGGGMGALQQFTSDKRLLYAAIERLQWDQLGRGGDAPFAPIEGRPITDQIGSGLPGGPYDRGKSSEDLNEFRSELFTVSTLGALKYIVNGLRDLPGRKSLLLISDGIKLFAKDRPSSGGSKNAGSGATTLNRSDRIPDSLQGLTDLANRASVVLYTMNARGLHVDSLAAEDNESGLTSDQLNSRLVSRRAEFLQSQIGLNFLAEQTGGLAIRNTNDLSGGIQSMLDDQKGYYLIGYHPNEKTFDPNRARYNRLKVRVKGPGLKVRYRSGFFGVKDEDSRPAPPVTRALQLSRALLAPFAVGDLNVQLTSLFANDATSGSFIRSLVHVDAGKLTFAEEPDEWRNFIFDIMAVTFADNGTIVDEVSRTENIRVRGETYRLILENGFDYKITVPVKKPGAYQLRIALRDTATERVGAANQFVEVPDLAKNRLALSGIVINGYDPQKLKSRTEAIADARPPIEPLSGPGVRRLRRGLIMEFGYVIYNAQLDKATLRPQLQTQLRLFRDGQPVFSGDVLPFDLSAQVDLKRLSAGGRLQLGTDMTPGDYVLQVMVTDLLANEKERLCTQWIDIQISDR